VIINEQGIGFCDKAWYRIPCGSIVDKSNLLLRPTTLCRWKNRAARAFQLDPLAPSSSSDGKREGGEIYHTFLGSLELVEIPPKDH